MDGNVVAQLRRLLQSQAGLHPQVCIWQPSACSENSQTCLSAQSWQAPCLLPAKVSNCLATARLTFSAPWAVDPPVNRLHRLICVHVSHVPKPASRLRVPVHDSHSIACRCSWAGCRLPVRPPDLQQRLAETCSHCCSFCSSYTQLLDHQAASPPSMLEFPCRLGLFMRQ